LLLDAHALLVLDLLGHREQRDVGVPDAVHEEASFYAGVGDLSDDLFDANGIDQLGGLDSEVVAGSAEFRTQNLFFYHEIQPFSQFLNFFAATGRSQVQVVGYIFSFALAFGQNYFVQVLL